MSLVYLAFAAHIIHWKLKGKTLAPLELNEVMYTLELGIITAGFLFMCLLAVGTLLFGRFFCSWACHIMVLQDLAAWILRKLGIRRKPIRSRLLLLVPPLTAFYMFLWPQIVRTWQSRSFPEFHFRTDAEGWASFATNNFWRNLPSGPIIALTFVVCGFLIVYLLGSRSFCTYVCPYGAIFGLADRFTPGRIRVNDRCRQCGTCTATCTSGVRVHEEVRQHGMVVNTACLKCLDCVGACPQNALRYGLGGPSLFKSRTSGGRFGRQQYDFTLGEELLIAFVFVVVLLAFRGLYSRIPFLLSLALGAIVGYLAVLAARLASERLVTLGTIRLRTAEGLTVAGRFYCVFAILLTAFIAHSAFVRYHEYNGLQQTMALFRATDPAERNQLASSAYGHLRIADQWGLLNNERTERGLLDTSSHLRRFDDVAVYASRLLHIAPNDGTLRLRLAESLAARNQTAQADHEFRTILAQGAAESSSPPAVVAAAHRGLADLRIHEGDFAGALGALHVALRLDPMSAAAHAELGSTLAELGRFDEAVASLRTAVRLDPRAGWTHYNLGTILNQMGRFEEAVPCFEQALAALPNDADLHNNLGLSLLRIGQPERSRRYLERAVALDPTNVNAHLNLANALTALRQSEDAAQQHRIAETLNSHGATPHVP